jgi:hypothetical protein
MLIKLAFFDENRLEKTIEKCCKEFNALYIRLLENKFGIATENSEISYGQEDATYAYDCNVKTFVDIYSCVKKCEAKRKGIFGKKKVKTYSSKFLDTLFFKNVISFCEKEDICIEFIRYTSDLKTEFTLYELEDIKEIFIDPELVVIQKLSIDFKGIDIVFNKIGYIEIASNLEFFRKNSDQILNMVMVGLRD